VSPDTTLLVVPGRTLLVVPRLAATLLAAAAASTNTRGSLRFVFFVLVFFVLADEGIKFALSVSKRTVECALSVSKRTVEYALGVRQCTLSLTSQSRLPLLLLIECHYIQRSENNRVDEIPSTGLEPAILTLGGSHLIQLGYEG
jgi:hypothetical protein